MGEMKITKEKMLFLVSIVFGWVIHFTLFSNSLTNPDGLIMGYNHRAGSWEIQLGRWGIKFIELYKRWNLSPMLVSTICVLILSIVALCLIKTFAFESIPVKAICYGLVIASPATAMILSYYYCSDAYFFAFLFAVVSAFLMIRYEKTKKIVFSIPFLIAALSIYQVYLGVTVVIILSSVWIELLQEESKVVDVMKKTTRYASCGIVGVGSYYAIALVILKIKGLTWASYGGANQVGIMYTITKGIASIPNCYRTFIHYFFGNDPWICKNGFWHREILWVIVTITFVISVIHLIRKNHISFIKNVLIFLGIILMPLAANIINVLAPDHPIQLIMSHPMIVSVLPILKVIEMARKDSKKLAWNAIFAHVISGLIIISYALSDQATYIDLKMKTEQTDEIASEIYQRLQMEKEYSEEMQVMIAGTINQNNYPLSNRKMNDMAIGHISEWSCFWEDTAGAIKCWNAIFSNHLRADVRFCNAEEYETIEKTSEFQKMGIYPKIDSVKVIDGVMVVRVE